MQPASMGAPRSGLGPQLWSIGETQSMELLSLPRDFFDAQEMAGLVEMDVVAVPRRIVRLPRRGRFKNVLAFLGQVGS